MIHMPTNAMICLLALGQATSYPIVVTTTCLPRGLTSPHLPCKLVKSRIIHLDPSHMFVPLSIISFMHRLGGDLILEVLPISIFCVMGCRMKTYRCFLKSSSLCSRINLGPFIPIDPLFPLFLTLRPSLRL